MKQVFGYIGAFALGVVSTVVVYEVARVVTNTRDAFHAASSQIGAEGPEVRSAPVTGGQVVEMRSAKGGAKAPPAGAAAKQPAKGKAPTPAARRAARRAKARKQWEAMSPEERDKVRAIRRAREELRARSQGEGDVRALSGRPLAPGIRPMVPVDPLDGEAPPWAEEEGEHPEDTGAL